MPQFNIQNNNSIEQNYQLGLLPQRNQKNLWYFESSCRSNLSYFQLSSENRRILNKTNEYTYQFQDILEFNFNISIQKEIFHWIKDLGWDFPSSSIKQIFTHHLFNRIYIWKDTKKRIVAYSVCYFSDNISHIAYVFYNPLYNHSNLPIRLVLQTIIDSHDQGLRFCYLGRFSSNNGYYKRNMPGFEYFKDGNWIKYEKQNNPNTL